MTRHLSGFALALCRKMILRNRVYAEHFANADWQSTLSKRGCLCLFICQWPFDYFSFVLIEANVWLVFKIQHLTKLMYILVRSVCVLWIFMRWFPVIYYLCFRIQCAFLRSVVLLCRLHKFNMVVFLFLTLLCKYVTQHLNMHFNKSSIFWCMCDCLGWFLYIF